MTRELDDVRFQLNKWETQQHLPVIASMNGKDPETGKITTNILVSTKVPFLIGPGMRIVIVPE